MNIRALTETRLFRRSIGEPDTFVCRGTFDHVASVFYHLDAAERRRHIVRSTGGLMWTASDLIDRAEFRDVLEPRPVSEAMAA